MRSAIGAKRRKKPGTFRLAFGLPDSVGEIWEVCSAEEPGGCTATPA